MVTLYHMLPFPVHDKGTQFIQPKDNGGNEPYSHSHDQFVNVSRRASIIEAQAESGPANGLTVSSSPHVKPDQTLKNTA